MRLDQGDQTLPRHYLIHLDQNNSLRICLRLPVYSASAKVICFIGKLRQRDRRISTDLGSVLQDFLRI
jgi:hypothetical protein